MLLACLDHLVTGVTITIFLGYISRPSDLSFKGDHYHPLQSFTRSHTMVAAAITAATIQSIVQKQLDVIIVTSAGRYSKEVEALLAIFGLKFNTVGRTPLVVDSVVA